MEKLEKKQESFVQILYVKPGESKARKHPVVLKERQVIMQVC